MSQDLTYFVKNKGRIYGPYKIAQVVAGLKQAKLSRAHMVSTDRTNWEPLGDLMERLEAEAKARAEKPAAPAQEQAAKAMPPPLPEATALTPEVPLQDASLAEINAYMGLGRMNGRLLASGIALTASMLLPVSVTEIGGPTWIFSLLEIMPVLTAVLMIYILMAGIAIIPLSTAVRGMARPITVLSILAVAAMLTIMNIEEIGDNFGETSGVLIFILFFFNSMAVAALLRWRMFNPTKTRRVLTCIFSSILAALGLGYLFVSLLVDERYDFSKFYGDMKTNATITLALSLILFLAGIGFSIAGGTIGIVQTGNSGTSSSAKVGFHLVKLIPLLMTAALIFSVITIGLQVGNTAGGKWLAVNIILFVIHFIVTPVALAEAFYEGLKELLLAVSGPDSKSDASPTH